ncbi:MAG: zinc ribbon domain-containing protein [Thermoanaerobaculia bacterium]
MSSGHPLEPLFRLQELLLEIQRKTERKSRTPDHLTHVEAAFQDARRRRHEAGEKHVRASARKSVLEGEIADLGEKLKKYQQQLLAVKTNREYGALLNELDAVKREVRTREDEILGLEENLAASSAEVAAHEASFPAEEAGYEEQMKEWRAEQAALTKEITAAEEAARGLEKTLDKALLRRFRQIAGKRGGVALARVVMVGPQTASCTGCHVRLRPQLLSDIRLSKEPIICDSCKRILYWDGGE